MIMTVNQEKLDATVGRLLAGLAAGYGGVLVSVGHKLGLYKAMAGAGPLTSHELAKRSGCAERYVREWLHAQAAGAYVDYHPCSASHELNAEQAMILADETSPVCLQHGWQIVASMWADEPKTIAAFESGPGVSWGEHDGRLFCGVAAFFRKFYAASLIGDWLPALDGVVDKLTCGARVADVGCGHAHSTIMIAKAFPASRFWGFDVHEGSIAEARRIAGGDDLQPPQEAGAPAQHSLAVQLAYIAVEELVLVTERRHKCVS
jgi:hypothetical protein